MNAMRSQLDHEKKMLKNDIEETLKCQSLLGSGTAELLYTSKVILVIGTSLRRFG